MTASSARRAGRSARTSASSADRGLYIESWLPERRSRRKPLYLLHGELGGSWLWQRFLGYFAPRGWEGHALNLRGHYWSETADFAELDFDTYLDDVLAGAETDVAAADRDRPRHGRAAGDEAGRGQAHLARWCCSARRCPPSCWSRRRRTWSACCRASTAASCSAGTGRSTLIQRQNPDLTIGRRDARPAHDGRRVGRGAARRCSRACRSSRDELADVPKLVIGGGLDRAFPEPDSERLAEWLGADYQPFGAHSHYGLVIGEESDRAGRRRRPLCSSSRTASEVNYARSRSASARPCRIRLEAQDTALSRRRSSVRIRYAVPPFPRIASRHCD